MGGETEAWEGGAGGILTARLQAALAKLWPVKKAGPAQLVRVVACAAALTVASFVPSAGASQTDWLRQRVLNIAHQGGENEVPSNTMYAYERALRLGADMLEVDIHTSADGALVVLHDATVDRTTNGTGRVYDMTLQEIQALDAGYRIVPGEGTEGGRPLSAYPFRGVRTGDREPPPGFRPRDFRIPTLAEVLRAYPQVPINIEIKGAADSDFASFQRNAEALAAFLNGIGRTEGIIVASFNDAALARFHELAPQIDLAPAVAGVGAYKLAGVPPPEGTVAFQVPIEFGGVTVVDEEFVDRAHGDGYAVHVWTINEEPTMRQLLGLGVDGIMTAEPMRLERVLCRTGTGRPARPDALPGGRCSERASIACDVDPVRAVRRGNGLRVILRRRDGFNGRCAGRVTLRAAGVASARTFGFGQRPPSEGGPRRRVLRMGLSPGLRAATERGDVVEVRVRPFTAFLDRNRLRVR
jgi:glycerophosphoryl diester phosphodiesterase